VGFKSGDGSIMAEKIIIGAVAENGVIGKDGKIPWKIPEDMERFKELTMGYPVIMGRKTYESIPKKYRPLPNRTNIVVTSRNFEDEEILIARSLEGAVYFIEQEADKLFFIGGQRIYEEAMDYADKLEITHVKGKYEGDRFFPEIKREIWSEIWRDDREGYSFVSYIKK
jgi:dihydrofolate reductase